MLTNYFNKSILTQRYFINPEDIPNWDSQASMDSLISFDVTTSSSNGFGGRQKEWHDYLLFTGLIDQLSGNEKYVADQVADSATHTLFCETDIDIKSSDRLICDGKTFRILNIDNPMNMNHHLEILLAYEGVDQ